MKTKILTITTIILGMVVMGYSNLWATQDVSAERLTKANKRKLIYKARLDPAPKVRIDGGSREVGGEQTSLHVLAPEHVGYTIKEKPTLYWYQSQPSEAQFEFALTSAGQTEPILRIQNTSAPTAGIHCLRLSEHDVKLTKGVRYTWYATLIPDPEDRSKDIFTSGAIELIDPPPNVVQSLLSQKKKDLVYILAEEGVWYDALDAVSSLIESNPSEAGFHELRADLLNQSNLSEVADYDRGFAH